MEKLNFSGHDTFHCRQFWLKKGFDFLKEGNSFNQDDASIKLGVGKNMVTAIRYWCKSFLLTEEDHVNELAEMIFASDGWDPFLEDQGTLWLIHYQLVKSPYASTFGIVFNELIKERPEFNVDYYVSYIHRKDPSQNPNTLKKDFTVFYKTYYADFKASDIEESFTGILTELNLLKQVKKAFIDTDGKTKTREVWVLERTSRNDIPLEIALYLILDQNEGSNSISFNKLYNEENQIGSVFALSREGLSHILERIADELDYEITYSNEAGIREFQIKEDISKYDLLKHYYGKVI